jgi:hypothetical protein
MEALNAAIAATSQVQLYPIDDIKTSSAGQAFAAALLKIKECFTKYQVCHSFPSTGIQFTDGPPNPAGGRVGCACGEYESSAGG